MAYTISESCIGCGACKKICPAHAVEGEKKLQHHIKEEICIECGACGRVCPAGAVKDIFGIVIERVPPKKWLRPYFDLDKCMSCNICLDTCPAGAISSCMQKVGSKHLFPCLTDESECMGCGFCALDCPVDAIRLGPLETGLQISTINMENC
jgi:formate hydrogenlyase subunit 6/NADH:ubiquinone oxidoreductase subunit I